MTIGRIITALVLLSVGSVAANAQKKHFEGEVTYSVSITLNKGARKFIKGTEGEYKVRTIYKNGNEKTTENYYGSVSYTFRDRDSMYCYSPVTNTGYSCTVSETIKDFEKVRKNVINTVRPTGETMQLSGITFEHMKGQQKSNMELLGATLTNTEDLDYWVCREFDDSYFMSIKIPGLYTNFDYTGSFRVPLFGTAVQHVSITIHEITPREVKDEELALPDIKFTELMTQAGIESAIKSDYKKHMKAQGKKQGEDVKTKGAAEVKGEWDF